MKRLMIAWQYCLMAEAGGEGGGGTGDVPADKPTDTPADKPADTPADKPTDTPADEPADKPADKPAGEPADKPADKPAGDGEITSAIGEKTGKKDGGENQPPAIDAETSKIADEEYSKLMVADDETKKLAGDDNVKLSEEVFKGMIPSLKAAGVKPEQASALANALAREQIKAEKARYQERVENCKRLNEAATKLYPAESDWKLIGAGVAKFFKPGSPMYYTITHSELGSDPEFLALMKYVGERVQADGAAGAASGTGGGRVVVDMAKALGIG